MALAYRPISALPILVRVPLLPVATAVAAYSAASVQDELREVFRRCPAAEAALRAATSSLSRAIREGAGSPADSKSISDSALRYLVRMASRCTPFGLFSAVGTVAQGDKTTMQLAPTPRTVFARLDRAVASKLVGKIEMAAELRGGIVLRTNDYAKYRGRVSHVHSSARDVPALRRQIVESTPLVEDVRAIAADGITADELIAYLVASKNMGPDIATATIDALLNAGVLVSDMLTHSLRFDDDTILDMWSRHSDDGARDANRVREALEAVNSTPLAEQNAHLYETLDAVFESAFDVAGKGYQLDSRVSLAGTIGKRLLKDACTLAELALRSGRSNWQSDAVAKFVESFEGEALVPLMDLADTALLRSIVDVPVTRTHDFTEAGHHRLMRAVFDAILSGGTVRFTLAEFTALLKPFEVRELPASVELGFEVAAADREAIDRGEYLVIPVPFGVSRGAGRSSGRFIHLLPRQSEVLRAWHESKDAAGDTVVAELDLQPQSTGLGLGASRAARVASPSADRRQRRRRRSLPDPTQRPVRRRE